MSTQIPTCVFSLDRKSTYTEALYEGKFYDLLGRAHTNPVEFNFRIYSFRREAHIYALRSLCAAEKIDSLCFISHELAVITDYQLVNTLKSLESVLKLIELSLQNDELDRIKSLTDCCYHSSEGVSIDDLRSAYANTGDLKDVSPYNTGGDEGINVVHSVFDYIKSLDEMIRDCIDRKRVLVNFHHPA